MCVKYGQDGPWVESMKGRDRLLVFLSLLCSLCQTTLSLSPNLRPAAPPDLREPHQWLVPHSCQLCAMLLVLPGPCL